MLTRERLVNRNMLLRLRPDFFSRCVLLAFAVLQVEQPNLFAMQEPAVDNQRNSLRIGAPKASEESKLVPVTKAVERASVSAGLVGTVGLDGATESAVHSTDVEPLELTQMQCVQMELALRIAMASMSHATPFVWLMAEPTSNLFVDRTPIPDLHEGDFTEIATNEDVPMDILDSRGQAGDAAASDAIASVENDRDWDEPPRLIPAIETGFNGISGMELEESDAEANGLEPKEASKDISKPSTLGKPSPRPVRIPFDPKTEAAEPETTGSIVSRAPSIRDRASQRDSQRDQEEPKLDPRVQGNEKDQQGVDALRASKPTNNRREIRIDDPKNEGIPVAPIVQSKPIDAVLAKRLQRAEACLAHYLDHPESTAVRSPWAVMHALLAFGGDYNLVHGQGKVNAIGWMCHNGTCRTQRIFTPTSRGFTPNVGDGVQGHEGQFMAILAQCNVPLNYPIQIGSSKFTVEDLVRHEMMTCKEKSELTFKLIGLSYYLDSNKQWRANDGKIWSIAKLIQEELAQPIIGAACGGVHRLMGFSFSVKQRQLQGQPVNGQFARAAKFVHEYISYTWQLQNPDGSFSTNWYEGRANEPNEERKVQTTGHMLEWLMYTLPDEDLNNPRVGKSIDFLLSKIYDKRDQKWPIGPRGHATRAVGLYQARIRETLNKPGQTATVNSATKSGVSSGTVRK